MFIKLETRNQLLHLDIQDPKLKSALIIICQSVKNAGGRAFLVGGAVRDAIFGMPAKDLDIEVFHLKAKSLLNLLAASFKLDLVGRAFGVIKIQGLEIDVSIPRKETKTGKGHREFQIASNPHLSIEEAAARRDFTINSILYDPLSQEILDPFHGRKDIKSRILRHTSIKFTEDPLRVLRAMQFSARYELFVAPETLSICKEIEPEGLSQERIFDEWKKLILKSKIPSIGLKFLRETQWIRYYPELENLIDTPQNPKWHTEGDVWIHTLHALDTFAKHRIGQNTEDLIVGLGILCHDLGKPESTQIQDGKISSIGHEIKGIPKTESFLGRMTRQMNLINEVTILVEYHLRPIQLYQAKATDKAVRKLSSQVKRIDRLVRVAFANQNGRPHLSDENFPAGKWLLKKAKNLRVESNSPKSIILGRHLIDQGLSPGPHFKNLLGKCYDAQLDGEISDLNSGIKFVKSLIENL